ncbi:hypothetical protein NM208_g12294 [Fusarium decemcellulare]|uniref:Uncharacterized protein n=1 Tax=Fusarium decemcellulare TaxID=57161 RepID=A0ACC1RQK6_9HYPO|nr:hypothetical protein NM208_g12294 [Fusarium decemcellulare]
MKRNRAFEPSKRALATFDQGPAWDLMQKVNRRPSYDPVSCPDGLINLSGALNGLMDDWMSTYIQTLAPITTGSAIRYGPICGSEALLKAAAGFFDAFFSPYSPVTADHILASNGVTSLIDMMAWTLCNPGEGVVYLTPNFYMLDYDLTSRSDVETVPISTSNLGDSFEARQADNLVHVVDSAINKAEEERSIKCRVLFICNPANPEGRCYSSETLQALSSLCYRRSMHLVADEIYAMSGFDNGENKDQSTFSSVLSIPNNKMKSQHIHCLYSLSKDFNMGGLRMGFLVTRNTVVRSAASRVAWFTWLTAFSDTFVSTFLGTQDLVKDYLSVYQERLQLAYRRASKALTDNKIPFKPSNAGLFIFIDLSQWLVTFDGSTTDSHKPSAELQLCVWLLDRGIFLNAGEFAGSDEPGHFRLVFTSDPDATVIGITRIRAALDALEISGLGEGRIGPSWE